MYQQFMHEIQLSKHINIISKYLYKSFIHLYYQFMF